VAPSSPMPNHQAQPTFEDDEDDLGFGNNAFKSKRPQEAAVSGSNEKSSAPTEDTKTMEEKNATTPAASSGSWLGRFWKRSEPTPAPIKANLGEQSSFYYDKDLKRWVNKKAGGIEATQPAAPPPPPSRAQTTSPASINGPLPHANGASSAPPPARPTFAIDLNAGPPMRVRSNVAPPEAASLPNTPMPGTSSSTPPPPPSRPRSQATKRNVRTRYVDVFQQPENAS